MADFFQLGIWNAELGILINGQLIMDNGKLKKEETLIDN